LHKKEKRLILPVLEITHKLQINWRNKPMRNIAFQFGESQEGNNILNHFGINLDHLVSDEMFFDSLEEIVRNIARTLIIYGIQREFDKFIGAAPYQRSDKRTDYRNGTRYRDFETSIGVIEAIPIPRARNSSFIPRLFSKWARKDNKIVKLIADIFIHGISTRKVKKITKTIFGKGYSVLPQRKLDN